MGSPLVLGPRTAYADHEARARPEPAPGGLADAAGVTYDEFSNPTAGITITATLVGPLGLPADATATPPPEQASTP